MDNSSQSLFSRFTNQYSLSKTLRFELKPVGKTQQMLDEAQVFRKDEIIRKKYEATKPYFDRLHREFVKESLEGAKLPKLEEYFNIFKKWKLDRKTNEKELQKKETELRKNIVFEFNEKAKEWASKYTGLKSKNIEILFEESVFESLLKPRYGDEEGSFLRDEDSNLITDKHGNKISIFDSWKGFVGYFTKFFETRKNFYTDKGTATALATRIIDQNLERLCNNLLIFEEVKNKVNFSEVEENFGKSLSEIFSLKFYNSCLLQVGIDTYNAILGADARDQNKRGINQLINEHRQKTGEKLPFLKYLDKQILSEKEKLIDEIETDEELLTTLTAFFTTAEMKILLLKNLFKGFTENSEKYDLYFIYIDKKVFDPNSSKYIDRENLDTFQENLFEILKKARIVSSSAKKKEGGYLFPDLIPLSFIKEALENSSNEKFWKEKYYKNEGDNSSKGFLPLTNNENIWIQFLKIFDYEFSNLLENEVINVQTGKAEKTGYNFFRQNLNLLLESYKNNKEAKVTIKNYADSVLTIYQMAKYFSLEKKGKWNEDGLDESDFYTNPENGYLKFYENAYEEIIQVYNKIRNYLTKKPYSEEKWKINFENPTLANGWDKNKESDNSTVILEKNGNYFLGIMAKGHNKLFDDRFSEVFKEGIEHGKYEKMVYKFFPDQSKMFPKVCFSAKGLDFQPHKDIYSIYKTLNLKREKHFLWTACTN